MERERLREGVCECGRMGVIQISSFKRTYAKTPRRPYAQPVLFIGGRRGGLRLTKISRYVRHCSIGSGAEEERVLREDAGRVLRLGRRPRVESGVELGLSIGHVAPEAAAGGPLAVVRDGDTIRIDVPERRLEVDLSEAELDARLDAWSPPKPQYTTGVLAKYAALFGSAADGAVSHVTRDE